MVDVMPTRRSAGTTPDLFSATPTPKAPEPSAIPKGKGEPDNLVSQSRYLLPKGLAGALKRLDDTEVESIPPADIAEILGAFPRLEMKHRFSETCRHLSWTCGVGPLA